MKSIFAVLAFFAGMQAASATSPVPEMSCLNAESYQQDENGNGSFQPTGASVVILKSTSGQYGYIALLTTSGQKQTEMKDVKIVSATPAQSGQVKEMAELMAPEVKWSDVVSVRAGNVGVKANQDDAAGIMIYELIGKENVVLSKLITFGWSFGRCTK